LTSSNVEELTAQNLVQELVSALGIVRSAQAGYDAVGWRIQEPSWAKARHLLYHLLSATTEVALLVEEAEHAEERGEPLDSSDFNQRLASRAEIPATLLFHAAQLANLADLDLGLELARLYHRNAQRFAPDSMFAALAVDE
jgi:NTP pyrophosphatase (non-canonical NTP hydrolase)